MKHVDILYFDTCPGWRTAVARVTQVVAEGGLGDEVVVRAIPIETEAEAHAHRFVGSPTVRIDGRDLDPTVEDFTSFGLQCRLYDNQGRLEGLPPTNWIRKALGVEEAASSSGRIAPPCCEAGPAGKRESPATARK